MPCDPLNLIPITRAEGGSGFRQIPPSFCNDKGTKIND